MDFHKAVIQFFQLTLMAVSSLLFTQAQAIDLSCKNPVGGSWVFGLAPRACEVSSLVKPDDIKKQYLPIIFLEAAQENTAREQYMSQLYTVLRDIGQYYILKRNPQVSEIEKNYFVSGLLTLAHQESLWSHYRGDVSEIIRYMRGDSYHGHGLMQVDDRSHVNALQNGKGVDLVNNVLYGLDIFYTAWIKSAKAACIKSERDFINRIRSSWSAYNGGLGQICRWKNKNVPADKQFFDKYNAQAWMAYITQQVASLPNLKCLIEGVRPCLLPGEQPPAPSEEIIPQLGYKDGDTVELVKAINLRGLTDGKVIYLVPQLTRLKVEGMKVQDADKKLYIKISYRGALGYLYAGHLIPERTFHQWIRPVQKNQQKLAVVNSQKSYIYLRACPQLSCNKTQPIMNTQDEGTKYSQIIKRKGDWVYLSNSAQNSEGWAFARDIQEHE